MPEPPKMEMSETETTTISRQLKGDRQNAPGWNRNLEAVSLDHKHAVFVV
jgi:hypothetical protein